MILEDQGRLADLLKQDADRIPGLSVLGVARSVEEGNHLCRQHQPDLLLMDLLLPDGQGVVDKGTAIDSLRVILERDVRQERRGSILICCHAHLGSRAHHHAGLQVPVVNDIGGLDNDVGRR
ncbi:MAG: hypothetical protein AB1Z22_01800 [Synechococcaceae cyanobacterium]